MSFPATEFCKCEGTGKKNRKQIDTTQVTTLALRCKIMQHNYQEADGSEFHRNSMSWLFGLGILMSWFFSLGISMSWLIVLWKNALGSRCRGLFVSVSQCRGFLVLESRCRGFLVLESQCRGNVPPRPRFRYHGENKKTTHNYVNYVVEKYFTCPNLCNIYLHNASLSELE